MSIFEFLKVRIGISEEDAARIDQSLSDQHGITSLADFQDRASLFILSTLGIDSSLGSRIIVELLGARIGRGHEEETFQDEEMKEDRVLSVSMPTRISKSGYSIKSDYQGRAASSVENSGFYLDASGIGYVSYALPLESVARYTRESLVNLKLIHIGSSTPPVKLFKALFVPSLTLVAVKSLPILRSRLRSEVANQLQVLYQNARRELVVPRSYSGMAIPINVNNDGNSSTKAASHAPTSSPRADSELYSDMMSGNVDRVPSSWAVPHTPSPFLCKWYDSYINPELGTVDLVLEYYSNGSLKDQLKIGKRLDQDETAIVCYSVLMGLQCLQSSGVVHGKIQPSNILVNSRGQV